jgi:PAS domain S-box-containing protein
MEEVDRLTAAMLREGHFASTTVWHRHRDGTAFPMLMSGVLIRDDYGNPQYIATSAIDMSAQHQAEAKLVESEGILRDIVESTLSGFWDWNLVTNTEYLSPTFKRMFGYEDHEMENSPEAWQKIIFPEDLPGVLEAFDRHVRSRGREPFYNEIRYRHRDGSTVWVICAGRIIEWAEDGKPIRMVGCHINITGRKRAEEEWKRLQDQLQQAQKMEAIGTLAGGIAHDFNNILGAILGYAEMAQEVSPAGSILRKDIDQIVKAGHRAKELVKQILAFSRQAETEHIPVQPALIIKETLYMLRSSLPSTIAFQQDIDEEAGPILADPTQIHQVMLNLCTNAFHAMEATGGTLSISLKNRELTGEDLASESHVHPGRFVQLSIGDTGPGIAPEIREKIFDPYFTTKEVGKGTGMGLAIIHGIAKSYKGFVSYHSRLGEGTVFHVYLPVIADKALLKIESTPLDLTEPGNERILFVDDEEILVEMGKIMLERLGYLVTVRGSSLEALNTFENQPDQFDLVITDQTMPGMTGIDMARRMLQIRPGMPIILCTGYSSLISEDKAKSFGIKGFANKPLAKKDIAMLIRKVLAGEETAIVTT